MSRSLWFVFLFIGVHKRVHCEDYDPPKITLERYWNEKSGGWISTTDENPAPDLIIKDENDYSVSNISNLILFCRAQYPIYWVMTDVKPIHLDEIGTGFRAMMDVEGIELADIVQKEFISYLQVFNDVSFSGLYTCRSVENAGVNTSTYLFLPGLANTVKSFVSAGHEMEVGQNGDDSVVIPCKVSNKNLVASLTKNDGNGSWEEVTNTTFYPTKGFIIYKNEVSQIIGQYKCSVGAEELIVNVHEEYHDDREFPLRNDTDGVAMWGQRKYGDGVECCSNSTVAPNMFVLVCENIPECDMKKLAYMHLMPKVTPSTPGLKLTSGKRQGSRCIHTVGYIFVRPFLIQCMGDGIDISGQYATEFSYPTYESLNYVSSVSIQDISYNVQTAIKSVVRKWENYTRNGDSLVGFNTLDLSKESLYTGDKFVIDCCGVHYYHAAGRIQRIIWKNGTVTTLKTPEDLDTEKFPYVRDFCYTYLYDPENEEHLVTADENMSHYECIVPRWYEKKPGIKRVPLTIRVPKEPVITNSDAILNVTYSENQLGLLQLECKLSDGAPPPQMVWKKDGYKLNQTDIGWSVVKDDEQSNNNSVNLLFMRATKEIEGEYECSAENMLGAAQKTFIVKVIPRSYVDYWIALVIFGGFFALIACCALRISTLEKQIASKQVQPMLS